MNDTTQIRIEKDKWLPDTYARSLHLTDVLRHPITHYEQLNDLEKDSFRQTQVQKNEELRVLGYHKNMSLIMKWDQTIGWLKNDSFIIEAKILTLTAPVSLALSPLQFFEYWRDTKYIWGGLTKSGIDCSGFSQRYYLDVLAKTLPKNSKDQRKLGTSKILENIANHNLIFCYRIGGSGVHHVGVYYDSYVMHAQLELGVIRESLGEFVKKYKIEEVVSF
jgi:hypothetical protein